MSKSENFDEIENVDIVNENDEILFSVPKTEAHQKGLLHRTVIAEIKDKQGRWILIRQSPIKQDSGQFVSPVGGHVKSGETVQEALKREALEEAGLASFKYKYIGKTIYNRNVLSRHENHYFILYEIFKQSGALTACVLPGLFPGLFSIAGISSPLNPG